MQLGYNEVDIPTHLMKLFNEVFEKISKIVNYILEIPEKLSATAICGRLW